MVAARVCEMATDLNEKLIEIGEDFVSYSLTGDESTDVTVAAQLASVEWTPVCSL